MNSVSNGVKYHAKEPQRFHNRSFLVRWTLGLLCILAPGLVVAFALYDPVFPLDLCDILR